MAKKTTKSLFQDRMCSYKSSNWAHLGIQYTSSVNGVSLPTD